MAIWHRVIAIFSMPFDPNPRPSRQPPNSGLTNIIIIKENKENKENSISNIKKMVWWPMPNSVNLIEQNQMEKDKGK